MKLVFLLSDEMKVFHERGAVQPSAHKNLLIQSKSNQKKKNQFGPTAARFSLSELEWIERDTTNSFHAVQSVVSCQHTIKMSEMLVL